MRRAKDCEAGGFVDPRVAAQQATEPKAPSDKPQSSLAGDGGLGARLARIAAALVACYLLGVQEILFAALTSVHCSPATVSAGSNVTCDVQTGAFSSDVDLSITQTGNAGKITMVSESAHAYRISFATRVAGAAGVKLTHSVFRSAASVDVIAGPARSVDVDCTPKLAITDAEVRCAVTPRDIYGNVADVEPSARGGTRPRFTVSFLGRATNLAVHDEHVSFVVAAGLGHTAGIAVSLDGRRVESTVEIE